MVSWQKLGAAEGPTVHLNFSRMRLQTNQTPVPGVPPTATHRAPVLMRSTTCSLHVIVFVGYLLGVCTPPYPSHAASKCPLQIAIGAV